MRTTALVLAVLFALPAVLAVFHRGPAPAADPQETAAHRRLETVWAIVPVVLLVALIAYSAAA
jgi:heme/copper-type cytochrome/quinol oxidase subunit 2